MKNLKNFLVIAGLAVVIVGAGNWMNVQNGDLSSLISKKVKTPVATVKPAASTDNAGYNQALVSYKNSRIQFNQACQVTPSNASFKNGTSVLLDNRSKTAHTVSFNGATYSLPAYGYQVVVVSSSTAPSKLGINCDGTVNTGTIQLYQ